MKNLIQVSPRKFAGTMPDMSQSKSDRAFNKAHLKAYLKGKRRFTHGFEMMGPMRERSEHQTKIVDRVMKVA